MPWNSTNIASSMGGITSKANDAINQVQNGLDKLTNQVSLMTGKVDTAVSAIVSSKATLNKLTASGFYMITLSPQVGSWSSRLSAASNAPPNLAYCCGTAVIAMAPDISTVSNAYQGIVDSVKKPMADASNIVNQFDFEDFIPDEMPEGLLDIDISTLTATDWSDLFETDAWKSTTLKDVFGGYAEGIAAATNKLSKEARSVVAGINQTARAASAINKGLTATKNLIAQMQDTGVYSIALAPGSGNYLTRLQNEAGAPDTSSALYTSGYVCIAVADSLSALESKYDTLSKILVGG